jgi:hypothetical protein
MIPVGSQVRWRPDVYKAPPIGRVTAHRGASVEIDGRGWWVASALLEVVGEMLDTTISDLHARIAALEAERDALQDVIAEQVEALADMEPAPTADELERRKDLEAFLDTARDYLEAYLSVAVGCSRPIAPIEPPELRALSDFLLWGLD